MVLPEVIIYQLGLGLLIGLCGGVMRSYFSGYWGQVNISSCHTFFVCMCVCLDGIGACWKPFQCSL